MDEIEVLMKEYEIMRKEILLYINKYYIVLTVIPGLLIAGAFGIGDYRNTIPCVFIPYVIAGLFGYMGIIAFYINKMAGYIELIEKRVARLFHPKYPPLIWETSYADAGIERKPGKQLKSICSFSVYALLTPSLIMLSIIITQGWYQAIRFKILDYEYRTTGILYLATVILCLVVSIIIWASTSTLVRHVTERMNKDIISIIEKQ